MDFPLNSLRIVFALSYLLAITYGNRYSRAVNLPDASRYVAREIYVQTPQSFPRGLDVVEVYADLPGRHPLAILTHGTSDKEEDRDHMTPWAQYWQALWFARRGYVSLVVIRRGYGRSGGKRDTTVGGCGAHGSFEDAGEESADDIRSVLQWALKQPEVDPNVLVSLGASTGGFAQVALASDPPKQLKAAINFAGGRGGDGQGHDCDLNALLSAFRVFGKRASTHAALPMLWLYAANDHWFPPDMAARFDSAYKENGGNDQFQVLPAIGEEGHRLYHHPDLWSEVVNTFLQRHNLLPLEGKILPPPQSNNVLPPSQLHDRGLEAWQHHQLNPPYKAFALDYAGAWGMSSAQFDQQSANRKALENCREAAKNHKSACDLVDNH